MSISISFTEAFGKSFKRIKKKQRSIEKDLKKLISILEIEPESGDEVFEGMRKIRFAVSARKEGKSGGCRVYYTIDKNPTTKILLVDIIDKREAESLPDQYLKAISSAHNEQSPPA